ncbi:hypothetical protein WMF31_17685 [Sorangium sp. So ce1036]|uniref:hypothetical protein n=1 Tax=Sorangium sp. So ce1036 TaxID=3133328 RepID=UPI003F00C570
MTSTPLPRPRPCIVTALELLGVDDPEMPEGRARQVISIVQRHLGDSELARLFGSHLSIAARCMLHVAPIKPAGMLPFWQALNIVHLQSALVPLGVLVRGAVALGDAVAHGNLLLGRGIAEAERLRDEVAHVPRVVVDPRLLRETEQNANLRASHHSVMDELGYIRRVLRVDSDGLLFVDYLWAIRSEMDEPSLYLDFFKDHRRLVTRKLDAATVLDGASRAWIWLWSYHNLVFRLLTSQWRLDDQERSELRIPATSPLIYRFPPSAKAP